MADGGGGLFEMVNDFADEETDFDWITKLSLAYGIPVSFAIATPSPEKRASLMRLLDEAHAAGANVTAQASLRSQGCLQCLRTKYHPFVSLSSLFALN